MRLAVGSHESKNCGPFFSHAKNISSVQPTSIHNVHRRALRECGWLLNSVEKNSVFCPQSKLCKCALGVFARRARISTHKGVVCAWESIVFVSHSRKTFPWESSHSIRRYLNSSNAYAPRERMRVEVRIRSFSLSVWSWTKLIIKADASLSWLAEKAARRSLFFVYRKRRCTVCLHSGEKKLAQHDTEKLLVCAGDTRPETEDFFCGWERRYQHHQTSARTLCFWFLITSVSLPPMLLRL